MLQKAPLIKTQRQTDLEGGFQLQGRGHFMLGECRALGLDVAPFFCVLPKLTSRHQADVRTKALPNLVCRGGQCYVFGSCHHVFESCGGCSSTKARGVS
jgi:hypothetical protein